MKKMLEMLQFKEKTDGGEELLFMGDGLLDL